MIFLETKLKGAFILKLEKKEDERGYFARAWCKKEFERRGLLNQMLQANISFNNSKGTLRGMHRQITPYEEAKLVRCAKGAIFDVIIDLRPSSPSYKQWIGVELTEDNSKMLFVPEGFAHGYQTLSDDTEVFYQVSQYYYPEYERGVRWNDSAFEINWPATEVRLISQKDQSWPDYSA